LNPKNEILKRTLKGHTEYVCINSLTKWWFS
jgi:hypothetical protein